MSIMPREASQGFHEIGPAAALIYTIYCEYRDDDPESETFGLAWPSRSQIARQAGLNESYVSTMRSKLESNGWIEIIGQADRGNTVVRLLKGLDEFNRVAEARRRSDQAKKKTSGSTVKKSVLKIVRPPRPRPATEPPKGRAKTATPQSQPPPAARLKAAPALPPKPEVPKQQRHGSDKALDNPTCRRPTSFDIPTLSDARVSAQQTYSFAVSAQGSGHIGISNIVDCSQQTTSDYPTSHDKEIPNQVIKEVSNLPPTPPSKRERVGESVVGQAVAASVIPKSKHSLDAWLQYAYEHFRSGDGIRQPMAFARARHLDGTGDWQLDLWLKAKQDWERGRGAPVPPVGAVQPVLADAQMAAMRAELDLDDWANRELASMPPDRYNALVAHFEETCRRDKRYQKFKFPDETTRREHIDSLIKRQLKEERSNAANTL